MRGPDAAEAGVATATIPSRRNTDGTGVEGEEEADVRDVLTNTGVPALAPVFRMSLPIRGGHGARSDATAGPLVPLPRPITHPTGQGAVVDAVEVVGTGPAPRIGKPIEFVKVFAHLGVR